MKLSKMILAALALCSISFSALAADFTNGLSKQEIEKQFSEMSSAFGLNGDEGPTHHGPCEDVALTEEQKPALHQAMFEHKKEMITLGAQLKIAFLDYGHTVSDATTARADAEAAGGALNAAVGNIATAKGNFATKILYDILAPEQRKAGFACMMWLAKHGRRGHNDEDRRPKPAPNKPAPRP